MKQKQIELSRKYAWALRTHLQHESPTTLKAASNLGRDAVKLRVEILELARIHESALVRLKISSDKSGPVKQSQLFFTEAITPIVETHRAARDNKLTLNRLNDMLGRCTAELAVSNRQLKRGIARRKTVEAALKKSGQDYTQLLKNSHRLQAGFRQLTHRVLAAQEEERKKLSCELQDEIAQTLLGVNVRLLSLREEAKKNTKGFKSKIASTRQMVAKSTKSVQGVATRLANT